MGRTACHACIAAALASCGRIGFPAQPGDGSAGLLDATIDSLDAAGSALAHYNVSVSIAAGNTAAGSGLLMTVPVGSAGFGSACPAVFIVAPQTYMIGHPTLPYAYGVATDLTGFTVACGATTPTATGVQGAATVAPRIAIDTAHHVVFFSTNGSDDVYRATLTATGVPQLADSVPAPGGLGAGPVGFDAATGIVATVSPGAPGLLQAYPTGSDDDFIATGETAVAGCNVPSDVTSSGPYIVELCEQAVLRHPISNGGVGSGEMMSSDSVRLSARLDVNHHVFANDTPAIGVLSIDDGVPTFEAALSDGPFVALAASADGLLAVGAETVATGTKLVAWWVSDLTLVPIGTIEFGGTTTALAITNAP